MWSVKLRIFIRTERVGFIPSKSQPRLKIAGWVHMQPGNSVFIITAQCKYLELVCHCSAYMLQIAAWHGTGSLCVSLSEEHKGTELPHMRIISTACVCIVVYRLAAESGTATTCSEGLHSIHVAANNIFLFCALNQTIHWSLMCRYVWYQCQVLRNHSH